MEEKETYRQPQQCFRSGDDKRFPEIALNLATQEMEVLRGRCREHDVHIDVGRCRQAIEREVVCAVS